MIGADPKTFTEGGGLPDDFDGLVLEAGTKLFNYGGTKDDVPALRLVLARNGNPEDLVIQHWSNGKTSDFLPTTGDGETFESPHTVGELVPEGEVLTLGLGFDPVGDKTAFNKGSNMGMLVLSMVNSGLPPTVLAPGNFRALEGYTMHFRREAQPERKGLANPEGGDRKKPLEILLVSEVKSGPGGKALAAPKAAAKAGGTVAKAPVTPTAAAPAAKPAPAAAKPAAAKAAKADPSEYEEKAMEAVLAILAAAGGTVAKKDLTVGLFRVIKTDVDLRNHASAKVKDDEWLGNGPWVFDPTAGTLSTGE